MSINVARIKAVAVAIRNIRDHVVASDHIDAWDSTAYDKWLGMLDETTGVDGASLRIDDDDLDRADFLMHLEAAVGFLETLAENPGGEVVSLPKPRPVG